MPEMASKATDVVRARVSSCSPEMRGRLIFTTCRLEIVERWKGSTTTRVSLPGGALGGLRQFFAGVPVLTPGEERILFLWTGPSGTTQLVGLGQGVLRLERASDGTLMAVRAPVRDRMVDAHGRPMFDEGVDIPVEQLRQLVRSTAR